MSRVWPAYVGLSGALLALLPPIAGSKGQGNRAMKRTALKRRKRLNPVSKKTRTERWPRLKALRGHVLYRADGRCEVCFALAPLDVHHVIKRSRGGEDTAENCIGLCRTCHARTDYPYARGRLIICAIGGEEFLAFISYKRGAIGVFL
jgi:5-methylcytosine-specific restriction endonuclease McrA